MKKLLLIAACWIVFNSASDKTDIWVIVEEDLITGTVVKVKNSFFYEYMELSMKSEEQIRAHIRKYENDVQAYERWEKIGKRENYRGNPYVNE